MEFEGSGIYQCYCKTKTHLYDNLSDKSLCYEYNKDILTGLFLNNLVTVLVSVINIVIRKLNMSLIDGIGYHTQSQKVSAIMTSIFVASFVNTGIILLLTNAQLEYSVLKFIPINNQYSDLNDDWYEDIGFSLLKTMLIMAFFPYVELVLFNVIKTLQKVLDSGFYFLRKESDNFKTKKKTQ